MAAPRKKWATSLGPVSRQRHESKAAAYRKVTFYAEQHAAGMLRHSRVTVWVDEGAGWRIFEYVNLPDLASATAAVEG